MSTIGNIVNGETGLSARQKLNVLVDWYDDFAVSDGSYNLLRVNASYVKSATPTGQFLRDDGTWQTISVSGSSLTTVLGVGSTTGEQRIESDNGLNYLDLLNGYTKIGFVVAGGNGGHLYVDDSLLELYHESTINLNASIVTVNGNAIATKAYADGLVAGLLDDRGSYNASTNLFPSSGGSGTAGAILKGDIWYISVAGTLGGQAVTVGDSVRALVDTPGTTPSNWSILETNIGYVPENVTNKSDSYTVSSSVTYASTKALVDGLSTKGTIKGSVITNAGAIPFATGVADTITSSLNQVFVDANKRMQLGNTSGTTWDYHAYAFDAGTNSIVYGASGDFHLVSNARGLGTWTRYSLGKAINQYMYDGDMVTRTAVSGSAGSAITWIEQFKVKNTGGVGVNAYSFFGDTTTTATAYGDFKGCSGSFASMRIRVGTTLPSSQVDGEINYISGRLHHYTGTDNTIAYLSDVSGLTFNASKRLASLMSL